MLLIAAILCCICCDFYFGKSAQAPTERRFFWWLGAFSFLLLIPLALREGFATIAPYTQMVWRQPFSFVACSRGAADLFRAEAQFSRVWGAAEFGVCAFGDVSGAALSRAGAPDQRMARAGVSAGGDGERSAFRA